MFFYYTRYASKFEETIIDLQLSDLLKNYVFFNNLFPTINNFTFL